MKDIAFVNAMTKVRGLKTIRLRPRQQKLMDAWEAIYKEGPKRGEPFETYSRRLRQARKAAKPVWGGRLVARVAGYALGNFFTVRAREDGILRKLFPPSQEAM